MSQKKKDDKKIMSNGDVVTRHRRARHDYQILDDLEGGLSLKGSEVKSLRQGHAHLAGSFARFKKGELWLHGVEIPIYKNAGYDGHDPMRARKVLLKKEELQRLEKRIERKGVSVVPLEIYFKNGYAKVKLGIGTGRKKADKRQVLKERDEKRQMDKARSRQRREF